MITDTMHWAVIVVTGDPVRPLSAIGPLASKREAEGYCKFISSKETHIVNIAPKNQYGAPIIDIMLEAEIESHDPSLPYPFITDAEVGD